MGLEDKTQKITRGKTDKREVIVIKTPLTLNEAREMFPYRPASKYAESRFGGNNFEDDECLLLNGHAERCGTCQAPTKREYLSPNCPDCDGRSEYNGTNPRAKIK